MNKKGFTLIELLVTVLIVMIIAGYALFAYIDTQRDAEFARAKAVLELIHSGVERAELEHGVFATGNFVFSNTTAPFGGACPVPGPANLLVVLAACGYIPRMDFSDNFMQRYQFACSGGSAGATCTVRSVDNLRCAGINLQQGGRAVNVPC